VGETEEEDDDCLERGTRKICDTDNRVRATHRALARSFLERGKPTSTVVDTKTMFVSAFGHFY
jgi:hypothetical protein